MKRLIIYQVLAWYLVCFIWYFTKGAESAVSAFLGGFIYLFPSLLAYGVISLINRLPQLAIFAVIGGLMTRGSASLVILIAIFFAYPKLSFLPFITSLVTVSLIVFLFFGIQNHDSGNYRSQNPR